MPWKIRCTFDSIEDFYRVCDKIKPDKDGCLIFPSNTTIFAERTVTINGTVYRANRLALERKLGRSIKPGLLACHTCDVKGCVNFDHLYEGTVLDNAKDRARRVPLLTQRLKGKLNREK
jgi:hypothetical protein